VFEGKDVSVKDSSTHVAVSYASMDVRNLFTDVYQKSAKECKDVSGTNSSKDVSVRDVSV
jgi:hypothetical protein